MKRTPKIIRKLGRPSGRSEGRSSRPQRHRPANLARKPAARWKFGRPMQKIRKASPAKPEVLAEATVDSGRVKAALDKLAKAQADLTASGLDLLNVAHDIARTANATLKDELLQSLLQDNLLQDLEQLRAAAITSILPPDLQLLPEAVLNWFCRHLELSQHLERGQELEVPAERLSQYDLQGPPPDPAKALVKLKVLAPGWRHRGQTVIAPRVTIAAPVPLTSEG